jgi:F-type H+-transporting ATPase subunit gamma
MIPLRDIRRQIQSVRKISHITRAMKTVSAIRLMKVQQQVLKQKPYAAKLREIVRDLVARTAGKAHPMLMPEVGIPGEFEGREEAMISHKPIVVIALGSDRGMCGAFNNALVSEIERFVKRFQPAEKTVSHVKGECRFDEGRQMQLIVVGKRLRDLVRSKRLPMAHEMIGFWFDLTFEKVVQLAAGYRDDYLAGRIAELWLIYTEFKSTARQTVTAEQVLPIGAEKLRAEPLFPEYIYEPDAFSVLDSLLPQYYNREMWRIFLESVASEHMARMRAMDMATVNASEMIRDLTLTLNKARQEIITRELAEISSAAEALRGT